MYSVVASRIAALLPALQPAFGAIATLGAQARATTNVLWQAASLEHRRASSAQSGSSGATPGPRFMPDVAASPLDAFQSKLQTKTEQEIIALMEEARAAKLGAGEGTGESEEEHEDEEEVPNPVSGELYGPRGREPTRYGDWENKGKCIDF